MVTGGMTDSNHTVHGLIRKREELMALRRQKFLEIKGIERDVAAITAALRIFDPDAYPQRAKHDAKSKKNAQHTRRYVLDVLREAIDWISAREITDAWLANMKLEASTANIRLYSARVSACLFHLKHGGLAVQEHRGGRNVVWRLAEKA